MVDSFGYFGIFIATSLEYGCFPVSSEVLLPLIGYFVYRGELSLFITILVSTFGGIVGSIFCYMIGRFGKNLIEEVLVPKYKSINLGVKNAQKVFNKFGKQSVLIARVFPIARTYISFPAGLSGMNYSVFIIYTAIGSFIWNCLLISIGYILGEHWNEAGAFLSSNRILFYVVLAILSILFIRLGKRKNNS